MIVFSGSGLARVLASVVATVLLSTPQVSAQISGPSFGFAAGLTVPTGQFHSGLRGEGFSNGLEALGFAAVALRGIPFGFRLDGTLSRNGANDALESGLQTSLGGATETEHVLRLGVNLDLTYQLPVGSQVRPYLLGGLGIYRTTISVDAGAKGSTSEVKPGWNAGGGFVCRLRNLSIFLEGRLVSVSELYGLPRMTFVPILFGVRLGKH